MTRWIHWMLVLNFLWTAPDLFAQPKGQTQTRLLLSHETAKPGETVTAGLHFKIAPLWHIYWRNSGDSGFPPSIKEFTLPAGITAGPIEWAVPAKSRYKTADSDLTTHEYHDEVVLLIPLTIVANAPAGPVQLKAALKWLECQTDGQCVPGSAVVEATLTIGNESKPSADSAALEAARKQLPQSGKDLKVMAGWESAGTAEERPLIVEWDLKEALAGVDFYPYEDANFKYNALTEALSKGGGKARVRLKAQAADGRWPEKITGLIIQKNSAEEPGAGYEVSIPIITDTATGKAAVAPEKQPETPAVTPPSLAKMLWFAFVGGMILNIMPCVFPVIALKILGFVNQSKEAPQRVLKLGAIYSLGVIVSFLVMAAVVIGVKSAGNNASWGMQMQNPHFTLFLTVLVVLVALNLFGLFEVTLGGRALDSANDLAGKEGASGAFFNGIFTTILATPCTAPFLAPALGFAFAQPAGIIVLMFVTVGAGLAFPYLLLSWHPEWLRFLPRPGAWMEKFKIGMGFPMLATAVWLFSFTAPRFGEDGLLYLGLFIVLVALSAWIWGEFVQRGSKRRPLAMAFAAAFLLFGYVYALEMNLHWRNPAGKARAGVVQHGADGIAWEAWSSEAVAKARASGRPVLVDFTADWCLTCKLNKKAAIEVASVRAKVKELNVAAFIGDFTDQDPEMAREFARHGSSGVPLVLVFPKDASKPPIILPTSLAPPTTFNGAQIVMDALDQAAK